MIPHRKYPIKYIGLGVVTPFGEKGTIESVSLEVSKDGPKIVGFHLAGFDRTYSPEELYPNMRAYWKHNFKRETDDIQKIVQAIETSLKFEEKNLRRVEKEYKSKKLKAEEDIFLYNGRLRKMIETNEKEKRKN